METPRFLGLHADALDLGLQLCVGLGLDACHFRLKGVRGGFFCRLPRFFSGDFAQPLDFLLRPLLREPRLGGFLPETFELGDQIRVGVGLDACELALERTRR